MQIGITSNIGHWLTRWLVKDRDQDAGDAYLYDFDRLSYELRPGDVLLVEGRSRVSNVIKMITQSPWTHSALYVGRLYDVLDRDMRARLQEHWDGSPDEQLIIEALLGEGTVVYPLTKYRRSHLRTCRPKGLSPADAQQVLNFAIGKLGLDYDVRQLLDLARFMLPYSCLPRRLGSSLFVHRPGPQMRTVCSTMLAEAFDSVDFPVLPFVDKARNRFHLYKRNPRLLTPKDFDYSPYFDIIKHPFFGIDDVTLYRQLPWSESDVYCNDLSDCLNSRPPEAETGEEATEVAAFAEHELPAELEPAASLQLEADIAAGRGRHLVNLLEAMLPARRDSRKH